MKNSVFTVDLRGDDLDEFKADCKEYAMIRWGVNLVFEGEMRDRQLKYVDIEHTICNYFNVKLSEIRTLGKRGNSSTAKCFLAYFAYLEGHKIADIAKQLYEEQTPSIHSNVIYLRDKVRTNIKEKPDWMKMQYDLSYKLNEIREKIKEDSKKIPHVEGKD